MRKLCLFILTFALTFYIYAGISYHVSISSPDAAVKGKEITPEQREMMQKMGISPSGGFEMEMDVVAENGKAKETFTKGNFMFPPGSYILWDSSKEKGYAVYPDKRQYIEMDLNQIKNLGQQMQQSFKMTYSNQKTDVSSLGTKTIGTYLCTGKRLAVLYDTTVEFMGKHTTHSETVHEIWYTDSFEILKFFGSWDPFEHHYANTSDATINNAIKAKLGHIGFPILIITSTRDEKGNISKSEMKISNIQVKPIVLTNMSVPAGYEKTTFQSGVGDIMKQMMQQGGQESHGHGESGHGEGHDEGDD